MVIVRHTKTGTNNLSEFVITILLTTTETGIPMEATHDASSVVNCGPYCTENGFKSV